MWCNTHLANVIFVPKDNLIVTDLVVPGLDLPIPIIINRLIPFLAGYNKVAASHLINGFTNGFPIHFESFRKEFFAPNLLSAYEHPEAVDSKLLKELAAHRLTGPFVQPIFSPFRILPLY